MWLEELFKHLAVVYRRDWGGGGKMASQGIIAVVQGERWWPWRWTKVNRVKVYLGGRVKGLCRCIGFFSGIYMNCQSTIFRKTLVYKSRLYRCRNAGKQGIKTSQLLVPSSRLPAPGSRPPSPAWTSSSLGWSSQKHFAFVYTGGEGDGAVTLLQPFSR